MKQIRLTENDLHKIISESVKKVLNELDSKTWMNAANKAAEHGEIRRAYDFALYGDEIFNKETNIKSNNSLLLTVYGFIMDLKDESRVLNYIKKYDVIYDYDADAQYEPGDAHLKIKDKNMIRKVLLYFNKFAPDSKYNNKDIWAA